MKTFFSLLLLIALFAFSCQQPNGTVPCIDVTKNYPVKELFLTDIADVTYLQITSENDDYLYSGTIRAITKNTVIITNSIRLSGDILFFSKEGEPKSRFNRMGNGPQEYRNAHRVVYDEDADDLFVVSSSIGSSVKVYSSTGVYKREIAFPDSTIFLNGIVSFDDQSLLCHDESRGRDFESFYLISKADGAVLEYFELPIAPIFLGITWNGTNVPSMFLRRLIKNKEGVLICNPENDTVFLYAKDRSLTPILTKIPRVASTNPMTHINNCIDVENFQFTEIYILLPGDDYPGNFPVKYYMLDKKTGEIALPKLLLPDYYGKEFSISPMIAGLVNGLENGVVFELDLVELKEALVENRLNGKLKELVGKLKEDDNNIYVMVQFK
ncbi:MAG: 6-bladed beta-propeller [Prevotellaceae bacterium]|jgi:hypothetical protein|nr:6-bladed beta-propeller [Prevotellaceae bacterium]